MTQVGQVVVVLDSRESGQAFYLGHTASVVALSATDISVQDLQTNAPKPIRKMLASRFNLNPHTANPKPEVCVCLCVCVCVCRRRVQG